MMAGHEPVLPHVRQPGSNKAKAVSVAPITKVIATRWVAVQFNGLVIASHDPQ